MSDSESGTMSRGLVSPLSSPGSVDPRRHSAYLRPLEEIEALRDQKIMQLHHHQLHANEDYSQQSLPRQYLHNNKTPPSHILHPSLQGCNNTSPTPLGFSSSTLNPRLFSSHNLPIGGSGNNVTTQGVTKPLSQSIKGSSSDHESSV